MLFIHEVRRAEEKDLLTIYNFICILEDTKFNYSQFEKIFRENIINSNYFYYVAVNDDKIIGFISCHTQYLLHHCSKVAEIQELFVNETYRGKGIGRLLINQLEKELKKSDCLLIEVTAQNKRLQTHLIYENIGFTCSHKKFTKSLNE